MRRRAYIMLVGGAALAGLLTTALSATAQTAKIPRVGILSPARSETAATLAAFRNGIRDLGYVEGQTIVLDFRLSKGDYDVLPALAVQLVRVPVDVIVTDTTSATQAAASATRTIPIVMAASGGDPVALGFAASLNKPGGNVTGMLFLSIQLNPKRLQLLKLAFPAITRVTVLFNPTSAIGPPGLRATEQDVSAPKVVGPNDRKAGFLGNIGVRFMIDGAEAGNRFSLVEHPMSAHALAAPLHKHAREDEYSYVLEGSVGALLGDIVIIGKAGDLIFKPRNQWHTFWNAGDAPARILEIISPAGFEKFFEELVDLGGVTKAPPQVLAQLCARYELQIDFDSIPGLVERFGVRFPAEPVQQLAGPS